MSAVKLQLILEAGITPTSVDRSTRIIRGAAILGPDSPTRRRVYTEEAREDVVRLIAEKAIQVYFNHRPDWDCRSDPRDVRDLVANIVKGSAAVDEKGMVRADVLALPGTDGDKLLDLAEAEIEHVGFSIDAFGMESDDNEDVQTITKVVHIWSVDVVTFAGTVTTFFEEGRREVAAGQETGTVDPKAIAKLDLALLKAHNPTLVAAIESAATSPLQTKLDAATETNSTLCGQLNAERGSRLIESVLASDDFAYLPDGTKAKIREAAKRMDGEVNETTVRKVADDFIAFMQEAGVTFTKPGEEAPSGGVAVTESAAAVPPGASGDGGQSETEAACRESATDIIFSLCGATREKKKETAAGAA